MTLQFPWVTPPAYLAVEVTVLTGAALTLWHAIREWRNGRALSLYTWMTLFVYGLMMEALSEFVFKNFRHGARFSVMFRDDHIPLYIFGWYPLLIYAGIALARRAGLKRGREALLAGILIVTIDIPFDILGPMIGWWSWSDTDANVAYRWLGVPVTNYYWHFAFGGIASLLTSFMAPRIRSPIAGALFAIPTTVVLIVLGMLSFLPFHAAKAAGVPDGVFVALALAGGLLVVVARPKREVSRDRDLLLTSIPLLLQTSFLAVAIVRAPFRPLLVVLGSAVATAAFSLRLGDRSGQ